MHAFFTTVPKTIVSSVPALLVTCPGDALNE